MSLTCHDSCHQERESSAEKSWREDNVIRHKEHGWWQLDLLMTWGRMLPTIWVSAYRAQRLNKAAWGGGGDFEPPPSKLNGWCECWSRAHALLNTCNKNLKVCGWVIWLKNEWQRDGSCEIDSLPTTLWKQLRGRVLFLVLYCGGKFYENVALFQNDISCSTTPIYCTLSQPSFTLRRLCIFLRDSICQYSTFLCFIKWAGQVAWMEDMRTA
jgi:hypothetical protein